MEEGAASLARRETAFDVSLGARSYPVIIGERLLASGGQWIAATLPGVRCARLPETAAQTSTVQS